MSTNTNTIGTKELEIYCSHAVTILNRVKSHDDYPTSEASILMAEMSIGRELAVEIVANLQHNGKRYIL